MSKKKFFDKGFGEYSQTERAREAAVYEELYTTNPAYKMGEGRKRDVHKMLVRLFATTGGGSLLDVGCGRGEALALAREAGFAPVLGVEAAPVLCGNDVMFGYAHSLPMEDASFNHVLCIDTLEHLLPDDVPLALKELWRVTKHTLTISASTRPSVFGDRDLHISARPVAAWNAAIFTATRQVTVPCGTLGSTPVWRLVKENGDASS